MELEGKIWKSNKLWLVEVPSLNLMTQGKSRADAIEMVRDAVMGFIECYFETEMDDDFHIEVVDYKKETIGISSNDNKLLLALSLRKQREKSGSTVREAAERLGSKSPNAYAQYEKGRTRISLEKYEQLLQAANPLNHSHLRIV